jgi:CheY-like chemotaxis protein
MVTKAHSDIIDFAARQRVPSVVVVDPQFDAYKDLAAGARQGRLDLHFRSSGAAAMKLARRLDVDAWLVSAELDDMAGHDFVELLATVRGSSKVAIVDANAVGTRQRSIVEQDAAEAGVDAVLSQPISWADLEELLELTIEERGQRLKARGLVGTWAALPVSVGAAVVAMAVLMIG